MATEISLICKKLLDIPTNLSHGVSFKTIKDVYYFTLDADPWEMESLLANCQAHTNIRDIYSQTFEKLLELSDDLQIKEYLLEYENEFAGQPDDSGFIVPILNDQIFRKTLSKTATIAMEPTSGRSN